MFLTALEETVMSWGYKKFVICPAIEGKHYPTDTENKLLNTVKVCPI